MSSPRCGRRRAWQAGGGVEVHGIDHGVQKLISFAGVIRNHRADVERPGGALLGGLLDTGFSVLVVHLAHDPFILNITIFF